MNDTKTLSEKAAEKHQGRFAGDFVLNTQKTDEKFSHVNESWLSKCPTLEQVQKRVQDEQQFLKDYEDVPLKDISAKGGNLNIGDLLLGVKTTEHVHRQLYKYTLIPGSYLDALAGLLVKKEGNEVVPIDADPESYDYNFNRQAAKFEKQGKNLFLRLREKGGEKTLRSLLTDRYAVINNAPVVEILGELIPGGRASHLFYDGDTLRANILIPDSIRSESDSDYGGGISALNDEIGKFKFKTRPFVFRSICFNGNIWDRADGEAFERRHLGQIDWKEFRKNVHLNIQRQIPLAVEGIENILKLKGTPLTQQQIEQTIVYLGRNQKLTNKLVRNWYDGFKTELREAKTAKDILSAFGIVQGLTRSAQTYKEVEVQDLLERLSAKLIDKKWDKVLTSATHEVSVDEAQEVLTA